MNRRHSSPAPVTPLDDEDLLCEILLRLPPKPSSLPRASLVCKLWRCILSDPWFLCRFRKHHRKPLLLGFFDNQSGRPPVLTPLLDPPARIPGARFTHPPIANSYNYEPDRCYLMSCRHGLAAIVHSPEREIIVWNPLTSQQQCVPFPPGLQNVREYTFWFWHAEVMCADAEDGHVHGDCLSSPFKLVFIWVLQHTKQALTCLYKSANGVWGDIFPMTFTDMINQTGPSVLVGDAIYWLLDKGDVVAFDFEGQSYVVIEKPAEAHISNYRSAQLLRTQDSGHGLAVLSKLTIKLWERKSNCDGVVRWFLLQKTIQLDLFPCRMRTYCKRVLIVGYDEESNVIVLSTIIGNFMLQLDSMQIRHIVKRDIICQNTFYPYTSFWPVVEPCKGEEGLGSKKSEASCSTLR